jgi:hypothetical protein
MPVALASAQSSPCQSLLHLRSPLFSTEMSSCA